MGVEPTTAPLQMGSSTVEPRQRKKSHAECGMLGYLKTQHAFAELRRRRAEQARRIYEDANRACPKCGERIPYEKRRQKYCGWRCSIRGRPSLAPRNNTRKCTSCGAATARGNKYCRDCWAAKQPDRRSFDEIRTDPRRRKRLIRDRGHSCEGCGLGVWMGQPIPLEMDHIDGNSDNGACENLRLLCPNCHAQTPTYKSRNRGVAQGNRQKKRRARYHAGKSY